jgi:Na+-translocating ferredoxin:NAD+ oxidoreductase subunit E
VIASMSYNSRMTPAGILRNGLDTSNPGLVQLLGLCPLLAVSTSIGNALGLGLATFAVLVTSNAIASVVGRWLLPEVRIAVFVLAIAAAVTSVQLAIAAWWPDLHDALGIFLPLIVTNCLVLGRAESFASRQPLGLAIVDGAAMGLGFGSVLVALGAVRELLGHGLLLALLPPGAFVLLGLMLAVRNLTVRARTRVQAADRAVIADRSTS